MNESESAERDKEIIDKIFQKLPASGNCYVEYNKADFFYCKTQQKTNH